MPEIIGNQPGNFETEKLIDRDAEIERVAGDFACEAAIRASEGMLKYWKNASNEKFDSSYLNEEFSKEVGVGNFATLADKESERLIIDLIKTNELFSGHSIIAEESDPVVSDPIWQWAIDPIDGTLEFANGARQFGVSIGLLKGQEPMMGLIALPAFNEIVIARKDKGVELRDFSGRLIEKLRRSEEETQVALNRTLVGYDLGYENRAANLIGTVSKLIDKVAYMPCYASASYSATEIARGHLGAYIHPSATTFDIGAAVPIIQELGGKATRFNGDPLDWKKSAHDVLLTRDPRIHAQLLELLNK